MHSNNQLSTEKIATISTTAEIVQDQFELVVNKWISSIHPSFLSFPVVVMCIGTDKHIVDCYGPLVGTLLQQSNHKCIIFGTLTNPVTAFNIDDSIALAKKMFPHSLIICLDAAISRTPKTGALEIFKGPLKPGDALGKKFTPIGDFHLKGFVNYSETDQDIHFMNDTRLAVVYRMAQVTVHLLQLLHDKIPQH